MASSSDDESGVMMVLRGRDTEAAVAGAAVERTDPAVRRRELLAFVTLAIVIWPIIAVGLVGGFGFVVWMSQVILGPPGPPPV
jgi:nitrate reductase NapE